MIVYLVFTYLIMAAIAMTTAALDARKVTIKDWMLWIIAPISLPLFILFYLNYKSNDK